MWISFQKASVEWKWIEFIYNPIEKEKLLVLTQQFIFARKIARLYKSNGHIASWTCFSCFIIKYPKYLLTKIMEMIIAFNSTMLLKKTFDAVVKNNIESAL